ncbi:hypothetical protein FDA94_29750 [Herbidospora galbida]|uniref:Uncharacterized protein n=1 Tax=Herbidospora galbida TaxID=2575442 RepID=A0A4U3M613_9ACTN|nr:hypothetical protein FDA94_29750 [Herbidospora galbida]
MGFEPTRNVTAPSGFQDRQQLSGVSSVTCASCRTTALP